MQITTNNDIQHTVRIQIKFKLIKKKKYNISTNKIYNTIEEEQCRFIIAILTDFVDISFNSVEWTVAYNAKDPRIEFYRMHYTFLR